MEHIDAYPLTWPIGWKRTPGHRRPAAAFKKQRKQIEAADFVLHELLLLGARQPVLSSNLKPRKDGLPLSGQGNPADPGVAVYFLLGDQPRVLACDKWLRAVDNLYAIGLHIEALRGLDRWGVGTMDQAFSGYLALPEPRTWWQTLGVAQTATREEVLEAYRRLAKETHPDTGGEQEQFLRVQLAWEQARKERGWG